MDQTFILIKSILIMFFNKTDRFDQSASTKEVPEFGALKGFSDSRATLEDHWETLLEEVT